MSNMRHSTADEPFFLVRTLRTWAEDGDRIAPHAHPWPQLIVPMRGVMTIWTTVGTWVVPPGSAVCAPARIAHAWRGTGRLEMHALYFRPDEPVGPLPQRTGVIAISSLLRELIVRSVEIGMLDARIPTHHAIATLVTELLSERDTPAFALPKPHSPELLRLIESLNGVPDSPARLAVAAGMSLRTLQRRFRDETGISLGRWLRQSRMSDGLLALAAGQSVAAVARRAGYSSPSAFVAAFRGVFGTTPGQFFDVSDPRPGRMRKGSVPP